MYPLVVWKCVYSFWSTHIYLWTGIQFEIPQCRVNCPSNSSFALLPRKFEVEEVWMFRFCYFLETSFGFCMIQCACKGVLLASKVVSYFYPSYDELSSQNGEVIGLVVYRLGRLPPVCEWHWGLLVAVGLWLQVEFMSLPGILVHG